MNNKQLQESKKSDIVRLIGLFLIVYGILCFVSGGIGKILSVPFTFLFGFASIFFIIAMIVFGGLMLVLRQKIVFKKKIKIVFLAVSLVFFLMLITANQKELYLSNVFQKYLGQDGVYKFNKGFLDYDSSNGSIASLNGGIIGYVFFALLNSICKPLHGLALGLTIAIFSLSTLIFVFPYLVSFSMFCYKKYNNIIENKKQPKPSKNVFKENKSNNQEPIKFNVENQKTDDDLIEQTEFQIEGDDVTITKKIEDKHTRLGLMIDEFDDELYSINKSKPTSRLNNEIKTEVEFSLDDEDSENVIQEDNTINQEMIIEQDSQVSFDDDDTSETPVIDSSEDIKQEISFDNDDTKIDPVINQETIVYDNQEEKPQEIIEDNNEDNQEKIEENNKPEEVEEEIEEVKKPAVDIYNANYDLPPLYLLKESTDNGANAQNEEIAKEKAEILLEKMKELNVQASISAFVVGPSVTRFEITLSPGVRVSSFTNLQEDFKLALGVNSIRIESPIPGKSAIGIEVPNKYRAMVSMKEIITKMPNKKEKLFVPVGKDITGNPLSFPIVNMPHCLISGATNSGKSVCANTIILSLLMNYKPSEVRMIMVDPKRVEMLFYTDIPHLLCPIITDAEKARVALDKLCDEMNERFTIFAGVGVKNIASYNELMLSQNRHKMSFILLVVDEFAELMLCKNHNIVEEKIQKLAQLGRAAGIHLILSTQRPDVNVIPGTIKTNLPCRMTFRLSSLVDSRTVIDVGGAEKLLNNGDMLLLTPDFTGLRRIQGVYVSDSEIADVVAYCKKQMGPQYDPKFLDLRTEEEKARDEELKYALNQNSNNNEVRDDSKDDLYEQIKDFVIQEQKASTSFLQRKFNIGYSRAARIIDMLEDDGIIGPENGSKPREVLIGNHQVDDDSPVEDEEEL